MNIRPVQIIKEFRQTVLFNSKDIEVLLKDYAVKLCGLDILASAKIIFEDETEGSPPYKIGVKARVELRSPLK